MAAKPVLLELPSNRRGFLKIEYCKEVEIMRCDPCCHVISGVTFSLRSLVVFLMVPPIILTPSARLMGDILALALALRRWGKPTLLDFMLR